MIAVPAHRAVGPDDAKFQLKGFAGGKRAVDGFAYHGAVGRMHQRANLFNGKRSAGFRPDRIRAAQPLEIVMPLVPPVS